MNSPFFFLLFSSKPFAQTTVLAMDTAISLATASAIEDGLGQNVTSVGSQNDNLIQNKYDGFNEVIKKKIYRQKR